MTSNGMTPPPSAFEPAMLGPLTLRNRIIKAATFEGVMPRGAVTDELIEFHRRGRPRRSRHDHRRVLRGVARAGGCIATRW